jgi:hypothetical protein
MPKKKKLADLAEKADKKKAKPAADVPSGKIRKSKTTVTSGGLLRRTAYFSEEEWGALQKRSYLDGISASEIIRRAVRRYLKL